MVVLVALNILIIEFVYYSRLSQNLGEFENPVPFSILQVNLAWKAGVDRKT